MDKIIKNIILDNDLKKYQKYSKILKYLFIDIANINQNKYFIGGSFSIREYKQINDLDIYIDKNKFIKLQKAVDKNIGKFEYLNNNIRWVYNITDEYNKLTELNENEFSIEVFQSLINEGLPIDKFSLKYLQKNNFLDKDENGHQFFNLNALLKFKLTTNRQKDLDDIALIKSIIETNKMT
jgi:hypothetical protein